MMPVYIFCAVLGIPLVLLFAFGGSDADGGLELDGGIDADLGADVGADLDLADVDASGSVGDATALFRRIPVSSYAMFLAFFGGVGVVTTWLGGAAVSTLILAAVLGVLAGFINTAMFSYLRNTDSDSQLTDRQIEGRVATVSVPIDAGKRGRVWFDTGDERVQLTAGSVDELPSQAFDRGEQVVIVEMNNGIAKVMPVDPELSD